MAMTLTSLSQSPHPPTVAWPIQDPKAPTTGPSDPAPTASESVVTQSQVLVIPTEDLIPWRAPGGESRRMNGQEFDYALKNAHWRFRDEVETDESVRQVIPYVAVISGIDHVLTYARGKSGGEDRLHTKLSIGIGGHVDRATDSYPGLTPLQVVDRACVRELREEIGAVWHASWQCRRRGLLISDADPVARVHVGVTYVLFTTPDSLDYTDSSIQDPGFLPFFQVPTARLETWSKLYHQSLLYGGLA